MTQIEAAVDEHREMSRPAPEGKPPGTLDRMRLARDRIRRAFREFLALPTGVITGFLLLGVLLEAADRATPGWLEPGRQFVKQHLFTNASTTSDVLSAVAAGVITVTSITVSVLLLAVQQSAASMSSAVFDQFLRRRENQLSFGYFIGLGLYTLVTLATVHEGANPVLGATMCILATVVALYLLLVLLYSTVDQMRPSVVLGSISRLTLHARRQQHDLVRRTRRGATPDLPVRECVSATSSGYVTRVELSELEQALARAPGRLEVVLFVSVGAFVAFGDVIAEVRGAPMDSPRDDDPGNGDTQGAPALADVIRHSLRLEADRDIGGDPAYGVEQIETIGWTSISSAKSNPAPGLVAIRTLRDLLARWTAESGPGNLSAHDSSADPKDSPHEDYRVLPVVYSDNTIECLFRALESLGVAAYESKQHQCFAEVVRAFSTLVTRLPPHSRREAADVMQRLLPSLSGHIYTRAIEEALTDAAQRFDAAGETSVAQAIRNAQRSR